MISNTNLGTSIQIYFGTNKKGRKQNGKYLQAIKATECMGVFDIVSAQGAGGSSEVESSLMVRRIDPSWGGLIELFLAPASAPRLV